MKNFIFIFLAIYVTLTTTAHAVPLFASSDTTVAAKTITQPIDHFSKSSNQFTQRYWISNYYAKNKNSPILIYLCGEITCYGELASPYLDRWAQPIDAHTATIEHRYYGDSQPFNDLSTKNLRFLELKQAMRDYVRFINHLRSSEQLTGPIILIGGSYSGLLAAMMRTEYPSLVAGAWSSSGPLHLIADYHDYDEQMTQTIPEQCRSSLQNLNKQIESEIVDDTKFEALTQKYLVPNMKNKKDFLFGLIDIAAAAVQYNKTNWFCSKFNGGDIIEEYGSFVNEIATKWEYKIDSYGFSSISDADLKSSSAQMRAFFYQQCSELGLFQPASKNIKLSTRSSQLDSNYMREGCERVFGRKFNLEKKISYLNKKYYERMLAVNGPSNIYSTAGVLDPFWKTSITPNNNNDSNKNMVSLDIVNGAHCSELNYTDSSPDTVKAAAELAKDLIKKWVGQ